MLKLSYPHKTPDEKDLSLGHILYSARLAKQLTLEELSFKTKIHKSLIHSLEENNCINLPNKIYVVGFLRTLSSILDFELGQAIELYHIQLSETYKAENSFTLIKEDASAENALKVNSSKKRRKLKINLAVLLLLGLIILLILTPLFLPDDVLLKSEAVGMSKNKESVITSAKAKKKSSLVRAKIFSQNVSITATEGTSWLEFKVDKKPKLKFKLNKGTAIALKGDNINLTVSNIKNVDIKNNGSRVPVSETAGIDIVSLRFRTDERIPTL